ncbi:MAG: hypothetical protein AMJ46_13640 [Latescibacteria bacterium DG_63]|nr:MAG: hypothetical protein AMJ46_13640 [Latescibacteria bacterium DG_63]
MLNWYKGGFLQKSVLVSGPNDPDRILSESVRKGERWHFTITPSDGKTTGQTRTSATIIIGNAPPQAQNPRIQPSIPTSKDDLRATYTYSDPEDGNLEGDSEIQWYKDGVLQPGYRGEVLPASATTRGDEWYFSVRPRDIDGAFGNLVNSPPVTIANQRPVVEIVSVSGGAGTGAAPLQGDITVIYNLKDEDGDRCRLNVYYQGGSAGIAKMAAHVAEATEGNNVITGVAPATGLALTWKSASNEPAGKDDDFRVGIIADDGLDKGEGVSKPFSVDNNKEPTVTDVAISPSSPFSSDNLTASYKFDDPDGDQESGSEIGWYKNGVEHTEYRNLKELPYTATSRDEDWYFTIQPKDGKEFGEMQTSPAVKIENAPPEAREVKLEPADATSNDNLKAAYTYNDADGDPEVGTQIRWYLNDSPQAKYDDQISVPSTATVKDQVWYFTVRVSDGIAPGELVTSNRVAVGNMAPLVRDLTVPSEGFRDVEMKFDLVDADNDKCSLAVEYRGGMASEWTPATIKEPLTDVSPGLVTRTWESAKDQDVQKPTKFQIRITPSDSLVTGDTVESEFFTLDNNVPPVARNLKVATPSPTTADNLVASYEYSDADGGAESGSEIVWYKDGTQTDYKGKTLLASATSKDQVWHFTVRPRDGAKFGDLQTSDPVTILNAPPLVKNVTIAPAEPKSDDILTVRYDYRDLDEDRESGTEIEWYKNGALELVTIVTDEDRRLPLPVSKGEKWHVVVKPKDGADFGSPATSTSVAVENAIPVIEDVAALGDSGDVIIMYSLIDGDGDLCDLNVEYQGGSVKTAWTAATIMEPTTEVLPGTELKLTWVSKADESGQKANNYKIRITPHDGISAGTSGMSPAFALNNNTPPTAENPQILPEMPTTSDDLRASYSFVDADGDREAKPEIKWYKNGIVEILYDNLAVLPSSATGKGDRWHYTIKVNDGKEYSKTQLSPHTNIGNAPPSADNVVLAPEQPGLDNQLIARYTYVDPDGDPEEGTEIKWYRDGAHMLSYDNSSIIPSVVTLAGDEWYFTVMPRDGFDFGIPRTSNKVFVANMAPSASSLNISPADPLTTDDLVASYIYTDPENDPEEGSRILWYKNSVVQAKYNDMLRLPADATSKKQVWHFTVQPKDGKQYGTVQKSGLAVIRNTPPRAGNLSISPLYPLSKDDLVASYDYIDVDGDLEVRTEIRWCRNDVWMPAHDGLKRLPSKNTLNGEVWYFTVRPKDETDFGEMMTSPSVEIGSPVPRVNNLIITPGDPLTTDDLTADYIYADPNDIPEAGSQITWYRDGVAQTEYSNVKVLPRDATSKDEQWYFSVRPSNGRQFGEQQSSAPVTILNSAPKLTAVVPEPADPTTDDTIIVDYIFDDPDGDAEARNEIKWFRDGTLQSAYDGMTELPAGATARGERWHFTIRSSDGSVFSELATSSTATVRNGRPKVANVNILPTDPLTGDDLEVIYIYIDTEADPESGTEIMWFRNGVHQTNYNNLKVVPSVATSKNDGWYCTVRPRDGIDFGDSLSSAVVTIGNTPPVAMELLALSDQVLRGGSVVIVSYGQDADPVDAGPALRCQISFRVDAMQPWVELATEYAQMPSARWEAVFRPDASAQLGEYDFRARFTDAAGGESDWMEREKMVAVGNSPPVIDATADDFHVSEDTVKEFDLRPYGTDLESGKDLMWALDAGSVNEELFQASISGRRFLQIRTMDDKNGRDDITLTLADTDGAEVEKADVTIVIDPVNDPPGMPASVKITPESPGTSDNLTCVAAGSTDPDNDTVVYRFQWYKDGVSQLDLRSDSVPYSRTSKGESWRCEATPSDGVSDGPSRYAEITVANTLPELTIREVAGDTKDILITFDLTDADGDNCDLKVEYRIKAWKSATTAESVRGVKPGTGLTLTWRSDVDEANAVTGDCRLRITPNDGTVPASPGESQSFFLDNKPPEFAVTAVANPIHSRHVDVTVVSDEDLVAVPDVSAVLNEGQPIVLDMESMSEGSAPVPARIWTGKLVLEPGFDGSVVVIVEGTDLVGNTGKLELQEEFHVPPPLPRPSSFALEQNYPNPVRRDTNIPYQLPRSSIVVIRIYSATGRLVRTLDEGYKVAGFYRSRGKAAYWDGNDDNGNMMASGVYFYHLKAGDSEAVGKMIVRR